jgi:hypothetical protein
VAAQQDIANVVLDSVRRHTGKQLEASLAKHPRFVTLSRNLGVLLDRAHVLPDGWSAWAAINPERDGYQVTPMDPALRSRFLNLHVHLDHRSWLEWAEKKSIHNAVLTLARAANPEWS